MSLVGSRPMLPLHETRTLRHRPGITGAASLAFRKEEQLLQRLAEHYLDEYQVKVLMPLKRELDHAYMNRATLLSDLSILMRTILFRGKQVEATDTTLFQESLASLHEHSLSQEALRQSLIVQVLGPAALGQGSRSRRLTHLGPGDEPVCRDDSELLPRLAREDWHDARYCGDSE